MVFGYHHHIDHSQTHNNYHINVDSHNVQNVQHNEHIVINNHIDPYSQSHSSNPSIQPSHSGLDWHIGCDHSNHKTHCHFDISFNMKI